MKNLKSLDEQALEFEHDEQSLTEHILFFNAMLNECYFFQFIVKKRIRKLLSELNFQLITMRRNRQRRLADYLLKLYNCD